MNYSTAIFLINKNARAVKATYEVDTNDPRQGPVAAVRTTFKTLDPSIKVGDFVVVPTSTRHKMTVCKVVETDIDIDFNDMTPVDWVICTIDRHPYDVRLSQEGDAITKIKSAELRKKREELRDSLLADNLAEIKLLPIAAMNGDSKPPQG